MNQQCKVCGEPAAGFHFGAFTCEGCKSFFGRTYNNMSSISECKNNGDCVINKKNRTSCKSCRLRKCLLVGMSKSGSRYGRRSNWFKIHCLLQEQGAANAHNGLNPNLLPTNGSSLYSGLFGASHMLSTDKLLEARLNGFSSYRENKVLKRDPEKYRSSDDSGGSSAGDLEDESRSTSVLSSSHQTPSPFSEKEYHQSQKRSNFSPCSNPPLSPFVPPSSNIYTPPFIPTLSPLAPHLTTFPLTRPVLTPTTSVMYIDPITSPWSSRTGGDLLLYSPAPGRVAVDQEQPIDLSTKSFDKEVSKCPRSPLQLSNSDKRSQSPENGTSNLRNVCGPLDLTSKRQRELLS